MISIEPVESKTDVHELKSLIEEHTACNRLQPGKRDPEDFESYLPKFKKIIPDDYKRMMSLSMKLEEQGYDLGAGTDGSVYRSIFGGVEMGKPTGFLEYERKDAAQIPPAEADPQFSGI